jgi:hypothetical protein
MPGGETSPIARHPLSSVEMTVHFEMVYQHQLTPTPTMDSKSGTTMSQQDIHNGHDRTLDAHRQIMVTIHDGAV